MRFAAGRARVFALASAVLVALIAPAQAEIRFGSGVRIGGHDFSNRRYRSVTVRRVARLPGPPGCRLVRGGVSRRADGSLVRGLVELCNLVAVPPHLRR